VAYQCSASEARSSVWQPRETCSRKRNSSETRTAGVIDAEGEFTYAINDTKLPMSRT
jgi:hypothetical protein